MIQLLVGLSSFLRSAHQPGYVVIYCSLAWPLDMSRCHYDACKQQAVLDVPKTVRWQIRRRLDELSIDAVCQKDGSLVVEVDNGIAIAQVHSVVRQVTGSRPTLADWLERCWSQPMVRTTS